MNEEQQRILIAEACGWRHMETPMGEVYRPPGLHPMQNIYGHTIPDYLNDLNAMHSAEKMLTHDQCEIYAAYLDETARTMPCPAADYDFWAPATLRAEAFLRAIGKWIEEPPVKDPYYELLAKDYVDASQPQV